MKVETYLDLKVKGLITLAKINDSYACEIKQFNPDTGLPIAPRVEAIDLKQLQDRKTSLQGEIVAIDTLIADLTKLGVM